MSSPERREPDLAALYDEHADRVFTFCLRTLGSRDDAAEATQQAFLGLLARLRGGGRVDVPIAYVFASARNACSDVLAARQRLQPVSDVPEDPAAHVPAPDTQALVAAQQQEVRSANARLPERQRQVLLLRELEELSYRDIAAALGIDENAVAQLLWRARTALRALVREEAAAATAAVTDGVRAGAGLPRADAGRGRNPPARAPPLRPPSARLRPVPREP